MIENKDYTTTSSQKKPQLKKGNPQEVAGVTSFLHFIELFVNSIPHTLTIDVNDVFLIAKSGDLFQTYQEKGLTINEIHTYLLPTLSHDSLERTKTNLINNGTFVARMAQRYKLMEDL